MDVLSSMRLFCRVAEAGSFSTVARECGMSQPTVSKQVAGLERHLGTKLLNRNTRHLDLTEDGRAYYRYCVEILDRLAEAEATIGHKQAAPSGTLRVTAATPFGELFVVPLLCEFLKEFPEINIDLILDDRYLDLIKEGVDLALRVGPLPDCSLVARRIGVGPRHIVASPEYLAHHGEPRRLAELRTHDCLIYTLQERPCEWTFDGPRGPEKVTVHGRFRVNSPEALREATLQGLGISVMCRWMTSRDIEQGRLRPILTAHRPDPFEVHAVYPQRRFLPQSARTLIDYMQAGLASLDAQSALSGQENGISPAGHASLLQPLPPPPVSRS